ncbi:phospholipid glycerol acyltransferase [Blastocystis sp. subtype 4]|uniref:phospholipid glycerol acyltransferase n=1 Tax=Blastocystis sp. subtype 4 TaxID=944170 RepID=UPI00071183C5|nr:phospholipid glycerol acyltransferase [Blastocystis sp. subtype 4]KNB41654.1 phospholipid glycerol acyltransferase [Blastocystis sp. subtype 4]|eukprot:XP_014525097.1 phospholipid glycerol acyltransferase [Blastocystis sp. subtype 4]
MFPEGTTRDVNSLKRSRDWAANTNRPLLQYLLLPRSTGLWALLKMIREDDEVKGYESYICDCTMQYSTYSGEVPDSSGEGRKHDVGIPEIATYLCPNKEFECHIHYSHTPISEIVPSDVVEDEEVHKCVEKWLDDCWVRKERELKYFIDHGEFSDNWNENRVETKYSFSQFIKDIRYWLLPLILLTSTIHLLFVALMRLFKLVMRIPVWLIWLG